MVVLEKMTTEMKICLQAWEKCQKACTKTMNYCLEKGDRYADMKLVCILRDCAEMCAMCVNLATDGSEFMGRTCQICAEMCERSSAACQAAIDDPQMKACAAACRQCAESSASIGRMATSYYRRENFLTPEALLAHA
jgi:hypothetical protein